MKADKILQRINLKLVRNYIDDEDKKVLEKTYELGQLDSLNLYSFKNKLLKLLEENTTPCDIIAIHVDDLNLILCDMIENKI